MRPFRIGSDCKFHLDIPPANDTGAGANNGTGVARGTFDNVCALALAGAIGAASASDLKLQESDDNSVWTDIAGATAVQLGATDDNKIHGVDARPQKKYVRAVQTVTGTGGVLVGVALVLYSGKSEPVTNDPVITVV